MRLKWIIATRKGLLLCSATVLAVLLTWRMTRRFYNFAVMPRFEFAMEAQVPDGLKSLSAKECGTCHPEIYAEWRQSIHSKSSVDPYFVKDRSFESNQQICLHCHAPLRQQQERLITGYRDLNKLHAIESPNPEFDSDLLSEGVTCAVCHVREGKIVGPFEPKNSPHPVTVDPSFTNTMTACKKCHSTVAYPGLDVGDPGLSWSRPLPGCGTTEEMAFRGLSHAANCPGCHMPPVTRPVAVGGPVREARKHLWVGGHHPATVRQALDVRSHRSEFDGLIRHEVTLENVGTPHFLPTGIPDRKLTVEFRLLDGNLRVLKEQHYFLQRHVVWKPVIFVWKEARLPSGIPRSFFFEFERSSIIPPVWLDVTVRYHLFGERRRRSIDFVNEDPISYIVFRQRIAALTGELAGEEGHEVVCSGLMSQLDRVTRETTVVPGLSSERVESDVCRDGNPELGVGWPFW